MGEALLKIRNLSFGYDENNVLKEINTDISKGEKIAVVGANGAGKSTFFLCLNGVLNFCGDIILNGKKIEKNNLNELRKNVGIVFQDAENQIVASTVFSEVAFGPANMKLKKDEIIKRVNNAISYMGISELKDRPPHYLSGGEKKRVTIADIIAMEPEIIIFDEPAAALDPVNTELFEEVLKKLSDSGKTILISTHDVDFAYKWADRVIVFKKGDIIADGTPNTIFENDALLKEANLTKPILRSVCEILIQNNIVKNDFFAKDIGEFKNMFNNLSKC